MQKRFLGRSGLAVSVLTFGCWQAGGTEWTDTDDAGSLGAMRAAYEAGINFFDTAEAYGKGHSEELLGQFLRDLNDASVLVASKVAAHHLSAAGVREACHVSLQRLQRDKIDLYQIHWPSGTWNSPIVPLEETMSALLELQSEGKIGAIGVSNFNADLVQQALSLGRIESLQPPYSLLFQPYLQNGTLEVCRQHELGVLPYSPLAQGLLTGKFNLDNRPSDNRAGNILFKDPTYGLALEAVEKLHPLAARHGATLGQLALAWLIAQPGVTSPVVGARNADQIRDTVQAASLSLPAEDLEFIGQLAAPVLESQPQDRTNPWR